ncbi:lysoplasmalogenase isoform X1 [Danio rerio]|uniref:Lysoplasmalogenase isoform X1 n=2 Tax=Danio rerio TaxID=7955 RepID=A0AC58IZM4_DANRE|nr:transmembrane protein 86B isoform X1 [Danio rerio]|eukprot:XP_005163887.1 transmembrane protein 86B isoform X1 [Danio rerio]
MDILETSAYDRRQRRNTWCVLLLYLLPFIASCTLYFYLWIPDSAPSLLAAGIKAAPILSLVLLVLSYNGGWSLVGVAGGLLLSAGGDCCLIWPELFIHGMGCFALAHLLYSVTFLSSRYSSTSSSFSFFFLYLVLWLFGVGIYVYLMPFLQLDPEADVLVPAIGGYVLLIVIMATMAARTRRPLILLGSLVFMASDLTIALTKFNVVDTEYKRHIIMVTYYLAQLMIALGDVKAVLEENADDLHKWKRS